MRITISGYPGSGKSTVAKWLAKRLKLKYYGAGKMRREIAKEKGMSLAEFNKLGEKADWTDRMVDDFQKKLAKKDNFIADGRLSWHFIPNSIKIFLKVDPKIGAKRIFKEKRAEERYSSVEDEIKSLKERLKSDVRRYKKHYGLSNIYALKNYDIIIDTSDMPISEMNRAVERAILRFSNKA